MSVPQIRLKTEGFRAIQSADIIIDGITVVAGENSSGKSTLSKLLYYLFKTAANYDSLVYKELRFKLENVYRFLDIATSDAASLLETKEQREELHRDIFSLRKKLNSENLEDLQRDNWISLIERIGDIFKLNDSIRSSERLASRIKRLGFIAKDLLGQRDNDLENKGLLPFDEIVSFVDARFKEAYGKIQSRPNLLFIEALKSVFSGGELPKVFEVYEFEDSIVSMRTNYLKIPYSVRNSIYIDTPMIIGITSSEVDYWDDLNELLRRKGKSSFSAISETISKEIIGGDTFVNEANSLAVDDFSFRRSDGSVFNLLDCATGIKSFAILQLLLKNGSLNDKTLLIIDEPESHLHPQWIIEYARLIVLLNKHAGIKFFIASHNPDMVSAIKYISIKEDVEEKLNFYLAEKISDGYLFDYKYLGSEIDPIFASFNIALDRINQYGV